MKSGAVAEIKVMVVTNFSSSASSGCVLGLYHLTRLEVMLAMALGLANASDVNKRDVCVTSGKRPKNVSASFDIFFSPLSW